MSKFTAFVLALLFFLVPTILLAENPPGELPIGFTEEELTRLDQIGINHVRTSPPAGPGIRSCAEWEPSQGVIIRYPFGISYALIAEMSQDVIVYTIVSSTSQQSTVTSYYNSNGVNMSNVQFIIAATDSYWTRDYGPWFIFDDNGDIGIVDHVYNRPRPNDDAIPSAVGSALSIPVYGMDLTATGGNYMSDGLGMAMATTLTATENPSLTTSEIDSIILAYLGNDYFMYPDPLGEYIEHIDCWAKFLSPQTILVLQVPTYHSQYSEIEAAADSLGQLTSSWGRPYTIVRVYSTGSQAYTNSLILNNKVFVPISSVSYDAAALQAYEDAMPGYEILGFTGSWENTDALHCRTMGVPDEGMLFLHHIPLYDTNDTLNAYDVSVKIVDHSGTGLIMDSCKIYYSINDGAWQSSMLSAGAEAYIYEGTIPVQSWGTEVKYYVQAADNSGRIEYHPYIGQPGPHVFNVLDINPVIALSESLFEFQAEEGAKTMLYDTLQIVNAGSGVLSWEASNSSSWLGLSPSSGAAPSSLQLAVNTGSLTPEVYYDTVSIEGAGASNSPQKVEVILTITPAAPTVSSTFPQDNATGISISANINVTFGIAMDSSTFIADNVYVHNAADDVYTGKIDYDGILRTLYFNPDTDFDKSERIYVEISGNVESAQGIPMGDDYIFDFLTEVNNAPNSPSDYSPEDNAVDVPVEVTLSWTGSDPDGDELHYSVYFGLSNPPGLYTSDLYDTEYELPTLENDTHYYWYVKAFDNYSGISSGSICDFTTEAGYICGDANGDEIVNVSDAVNIINYIFIGGAAPDPLESADVNCDTIVNVSDAVWIINYIFIGGDDPCDTDGDSNPDC